ncbi:sterol carrier family protein [Streptomyces sp. NPDC004609]|uniref:maleylpyruvate isomerase family mycothiol-dependent enzyme n=1 Tax=Streptomyces sp. NPDC004609 TaxID=3364704 RepID=UPI0036CEB074
MPPVRKRPRSYDPVRTRAAVLAQFGSVREAVQALGPAELALPTRLGQWTVRELAAHMALVAESVVRGIERPEPAKAEVSLLEWPSATAAYAGPIDEDPREPASAGQLGELYTRTASRLAGALADTPGHRLVPTRLGAMRLEDFLVTRAVELTVHTDDLNDAAGLSVPHDRQALAACTRLLADALAAKAPGGSVEVRVPPYAVVQCVEGPRHTRGTPPNVVETDPLTWIRLATGRTEWAEAVDAARVSASGERADLAALLPVLG